MGMVAPMVGRGGGPAAPAEAFHRPRRRPFGRFSGMIKLVLPAAAALILGLLLAWPAIVPRQETVLPPMPEMTGSGGEEARVRNLQFSGFDKNARPFTITAEEGIQPEPGGDAVILERPNADIGLKDGAWLAASADRGYYDRKTEQLELDGSVNLLHDKGFELKTEKANVDFKNGIAWSDEDVEATGPQGIIRSEGLQVLDKGRRVIFTGRSHLTVYPSGS